MYALSRIRTAHDMTSIYAVRRRDVCDLDLPGSRPDHVYFVLQVDKLGTSQDNGRLFVIRWGLRVRYTPGHLAGTNPRQVV
jgi:hypothetical protein